MIGRLQEAPTLDLAGKKRIAEQHLSWLIQKDREKFATPLSLQEIKDAFQYIFLPNSLMTELGFHNLFWAYKLHGTGLCRVFFGRETEEENNYPLINAGQATIEVTSRAIIDRSRSDFIMPWYPDALFIRIAGIHEQTERIVAASYDAQTRELIEANISVNGEEMASLINTTKGSLDIVSSSSQPFVAAGLITETMTRKVGHYNLITIRPGEDGLFSISGKYPTLRSNELDVRVHDVDTLMVGTYPTGKRGSTIELPTKLQGKP